MHAEWWQELPLQLHPEDGVVLTTFAFSMNPPAALQMMAKHMDLEAMYMERPPYLKICGVSLLLPFLFH